MSRPEEALVRFCGQQAYPGAGAARGVLVAEGRLGLLLQVRNSTRSRHRCLHLLLPAAVVAGHDGASGSKAFKQSGHGRWAQQVSIRLPRHDQHNPAAGGALTQPCDVTDTGTLEEAVAALERRLHSSSSDHHGHGVVHNSVFYTVLKRCAAHKELALGARVHSLAVATGHDADSYVANHIICMYAAHGKLQEAAQAFRRVAAPSRYVWASIIRAHARHGQPAEAVRLYRQMRRGKDAGGGRGGVTPDSRVFLAVVRACAAAEDLEAGREVHADMEARGATQPDVFVLNALVDMYAKCGSVDEARTVLDAVPDRHRTVVTWTAMIGGYARQGRCRDALALHDAMRAAGCAPNRVTLLCLVRACAAAGPAALPDGRRLHALLRDGDLLDQDVVLGNAVVDMYAKCGSLEDARGVFDSLPCKTVVTWTAMIAGYAKHGMGRRALDVYACMQREGVTPANWVTFLCLLQACAGARDLGMGRQVHAQLLLQQQQGDGGGGDVVVGTALVDMYAKCGSLVDAQSVFDSMGSSRNVATWNAIIAGYAQQGRAQEALALYAAMQKQEDFAAASPDAVTYVALLQACGSAAAYETGKRIHAHITTQLGGDDGDESVLLGNALVDMYGKCGSMVDAQQVFDGMPTRNSVTWGCLIGGYARQGQSALVFDLFHRMTLEEEEGVQPTATTLLSVLAACSHAGLWDEATAYLEAMVRDHGMSPTLEHYTCLVDLLGRLGRVEQAMELAAGLPVEPDGVTWRCVLGACQKWNRVELARHAFERAVRLDRDDAGAYLLMANVYRAAGMYGEADEVQVARSSTRACKEPGDSWWTGGDGVGRTFVAGDRGHVEWQQQMGAFLHHLFLLMREEEEEYVCFQYTRNKSCKCRLWTTCYCNLFMNR